MSLTDLQKRWQIFSELIYYIFDSLLVPLIRSNFHVTESNVHRNRIFFFRHDVWRSLTEPALAALKHSMFENLETNDAQRAIRRRRLGYSQIRLLPKTVGLRPIMNLRRRVVTISNGRKVFGPSINTILNPVFNMLSYEKVVLAQKSSCQTAMLTIEARSPNRTE